MRVGPLATATLLLATLTAPIASAHTRSYSYSSWVWEGTHATARFRFHQANAAELIVGPGLERGAIGPSEMRRLRGILRDRVAEGVHVSQGGVECSLIGQAGLARVAGRQLVVDARVECPEPVAVAGVRVEVDMLPELRGAHTHLIRMRVGDEDRDAALGRFSAHFVWPGTAEPDTSTGWQTFTSYLKTGVLHIATGWDHLTFLFMLILLVWLGSGSRRRMLLDLVGTATAFTVGHSVTLALAATGQVRPRGATVELLIALSILVLALEGFAALDKRSRTVRLAGGALLGGAPVLVWAVGGGHSPLVLVGLALFAVAYLEWMRRPARQPSGVLRGAVAFAFGLVHGFGFAGVLVETQLSGINLVVALLSFNLGVELGQSIALVALTGALWRFHGGPLQRPAVLLGSTVTFWVAAYWAGTRILG